MEYFHSEKQVGSSTMAQKRNPIVCENITGLARVVRGFLTPAWEGAVQWHERDLSNSAAERFVIPHVAVLTDDVVTKSTNLFRNLVVNTDRMAENVTMSGGRVMAERVIMTLAEKGMGRQEAHERVRKASLVGGDFTADLLADEMIGAALTADDLKELLDPATYTGSAGDIVDRVVAAIRKG
jgi:adenylosuccinate lyase